MARTMARQTAQRGLKTHWFDQHQPLLDAARPDDALDLGRDVLEAHPLRQVEGQVFGEGFHGWTGLRDEVR